MRIISRQVGVALCMVALLVMWCALPRACRAANTRDDQSTLTFGSLVTDTLASGSSITYHIAMTEAGPLSLRYTTGVEATLPMELHAGAADGTLVGSISNSLAEKYLYLPSIDAGDYYLILNNSLANPVNFSLLADTTLPVVPLTDPTNLPPGGHTNIYPITVTTTGPVYVTIKKPDPVATVEQIYGAGIINSPLATASDTNGQFMKLDSASPGTYYLLVHTANLAVGTKACSITVSNTLPQLTLGTPQSGQLAFQHDYALYRVDATSTNPLFVSLLKDTPWAAYVEVHQGSLDGPIVAQVGRGADPTPAMPDQWFEVPGVTPGPYYIRIEPFDPVAGVSAPSNFTITAAQSLPELTATPTQVTLPGTHSIRWYHLTGTAGSPLFAFADDNSSNTLTLALVKGAITNPATTTASGAGDQLLYLAQADKGDYFVKVSGTVPSFQLTGGQHLPTITDTTPANDTIAGNGDVHWYEVPIAANENVVLHLEKHGSYSTDTPFYFTSPLNASAPTGNTIGDSVQILSPTTATTYFVRVTGAQGSYTLHAYRTFPALTAGQANEAVMDHAGSERWFEITSTAGKPLFIASNKVQGTNTTIEVFRDTVTTKVGQLGGTTSNFAYMLARTQATRYIIHKKAPLTGFTADSAETLYADAALPLLSPGDTKNGNIASQYDVQFYQINWTSGMPMYLQSNLPLQITEASTSRTYTINPSTAIAGFYTPTVVMMGSANPASYTLSAGTDLSTASKLLFNNGLVEATVDLAKTTVGHVKYLGGSNTYLGDDLSNASVQTLQQPEGAAYTSGWQITGIGADNSGLQLNWFHQATQVTKTLLIRATSLRAELTCQLNTPRPMVMRNALILPSAQGSTYTFAYPDSSIVTQDYALSSGDKPLYPSTLNDLAAPTDKWVAYWSSAFSEVYGLTFGANFKAGLTTSGAYTVARVLCPAGQSSYTVEIVIPKPTPPYKAISSLTAVPSLTLLHTADAVQVPLGSPITGTVTVQNIGNAAASGVAVSCVLPANVTFVDSSASNGGQYYPSSRTVYWNIGSLAVGTVLKLTYSFSIATTVPMNTNIGIDAVLQCNELVGQTRAHCQVTASPPSISTVTPGDAGNAGPLTLFVYGTCFSPSATVQLVQGSQIITAAITDMSADRTQLRVLADVTGLTGDWDVTVTNPGGATSTLAGAITLTAGGQSSFWCEINAPTTLQQGKSQTIVIQYGNRGSADDVGRLLCLYIPSAKYTTGAVYDDKGRALASSAQQNSLAGPLLFWLPRIGPGEMHVFSVDINPQVLSSKAGTQYPDISLLTAPLSRAQLDSLAQSATATALKVKDVDLPAFNTLIVNADQTGLARWAQYDTQPLWAIADEAVRELHAKTSLAGYLSQSDDKTVAALLEQMITTVNAGNPFTPLTLKRVYQPNVTAAGLVNSKTGPIGCAGIGYVMENYPFTYQIVGKNPANASGAAKSILISDTLDSSFDPTTMRLGAMRVGGKTVQFPVGITSYHGYLDMRPQVNSIAEITIAYNSSSGTIQWNVSGFDPQTTAQNDLLPPDTDDKAPQGEVFVIFTVYPKAALPSGTLIKNVATVALDGWNSSPTNEVDNIIDSQAPTSAVYPLPAMQEDTTVTVKWHGKDEENGSGLVCYTIYVSDNDGPYTAWQYRVTTTSADFIGTLGHTYKFYSSAEDAVGHIEAPHTTPDATITLARSLQLTKGLHLVSLPINPTNIDPQAVLKFTDNKWARFIPGMGYVTYVNDTSHLTWFDPPSSVPGRAYWGYWGSDTQLSPDGPYLPLSGTYSIDLDTGWNMIGNPWPKPLTWDLTAIQVTTDSQTRPLSDAISMGFVSEYLWGWTPSTTKPGTGQYYMVADATITPAKHTLEAWQGYWIKATRPCTLILPAPNAPTAAASKAAGTGSRWLVPGVWEVPLTAHSAQGDDESHWFGIGTGAQVAQASKLLAPPSAPIPGLELDFSGEGSGRLVDLRGQGIANPVWRFTVTSPAPGDAVTLNWPDLSSLPSNLTLRLVNERTKGSCDLRSTAGYRFTMPANGQPVAFRVEVQKREPVKITLFKVQAIAGQRRGLQVQYTLSRDATAMVDIYSQNGTKIRHIDAGIAAGQTLNAITWDGCNAKGTAVPNGIYRVTLSVVDDGNHTARATTLSVLR